MSLPKRIDELDTASQASVSLSAGAAVAVVTGGKTIQTTMDQFGALGSFLQSGTGAVARTFQDKDRDIVSVKDFGAKGDGVTNDTAAIQAALTASNEVIVPDGTYKLDAGTNFAAAGKTLRGIGKPVLDFSAGTGIGFKLDAGGSGANIRGMRMDNFVIKGGPSITDIFYSRGIVASEFTNLECREGTATGFALKFAVLNTYKDCRVSNDSLAMTTTPTNYFNLDNDGTAGNRCQANVFINCDTSGKGASSNSTGFVLIDSTLNRWIGGTAESLNKGIDIQNDQCRLNTFSDFDMEDNVTNDVIVKGTNNRFDNVLSLSTCSGNNIDITTGKGTIFSGGGYLRLVNLGASSSNSSFLGVGIDESLGGTLGIQGSGSYTRFGCSKIGNTGLVTGTWWDVSLGAIGASDAAVGVVGEYIETAVASAGVALATGTSKTVGSISLTAGDWDVFGNIVFTGNAATTVTQLRGGASQTDNALGVANTVFTEPYVGGVLLFGGNDPAYPIPSQRMSLGTTTTVYLVANAIFAVNSCNAYGIISARRRR